MEPSAVFVVVIILAGDFWLSCHADYYGRPDGGGLEVFPVSVQEVTLNTSSGTVFEETAYDFNATISEGPSNTNFTLMDVFQITTELPQTTLDNEYVIESVSNSSNVLPSLNKKDKKSTLMCVVLIMFFVSVVAIELYFVLTERFCRIRCYWDVNVEAQKKNTFMEESFPDPPPCSSTGHLNPTFSSDEYGWDVNVEVEKGTFVVKSFPGASTDHKPYSSSKEIDVIEVIFHKEGRFRSDQSTESV